MDQIKFLANFRDLFLQPCEWRVITLLLAVIELPLGSITVTSPIIMAACREQ